MNSGSLFPGDFEGNVFVKREEKLHSLEKGVII